MAFNCICVDFQNSKENLNTIKQRMPHAKVIPFVQSYMEILKSLVNDARTSHVWMLSSLIDYSTFDFDYIQVFFTVLKIYTDAIRCHKNLLSFCKYNLFLHSVRMDKLAN